jgi:hypothetical protein
VLAEIHFSVVAVGERSADSGILDGRKAVYLRIKAFGNEQESALQQHQIAVISVLHTM